MAIEWKGEILYEFEHCTTESRKIKVQIKQSNSKNWISISTMKRWNTDGQFHYHKTICIELNDFSQNILPAINEMCKKANSLDF